MSGRRAALLVFVGLAALYLADGSFVPANGAKPNAWLSVAVLEHHALSFSRAEEPFMFGARGEKYYLAPSAIADRYVGTFGVGAGLTALPAFALVRLLAGDLRAHPALIWWTARVVAALCVAGSGAFVFLCALLLATPRRALFVTAVYALGGCAWSIASQALYQHGPNVLFLALGAWALVAAGEDRRRWAALAGLALALAVACRPTSAIPLACVLVWLLAVRRRLALPFCVAAALPLALLALYQWRWLGAPWETGQTARAATIALQKTGIADAWQTPLVAGAAGLLLSPSRGLVIFSPLLALAPLGFVRAWSRRPFAPLVPLGVAALLMFLVACKWFDWWGGWTYGYRPLVDVTPLLALGLLPALDVLAATVTRRIACAALLVWSIAVQALGAFAYDTIGWNARVVDGRPRDIDRPEWRARLWSISDGEIVYYASHFMSARRTRVALAHDFIAHPED